MLLCPKGFVGFNPPAGLKLRWLERTPDKPGEVLRSKSDVNMKGAFRRPFARYFHRENCRTRRRAARAMSLSVRVPMLPQILITGWSCWRSASRRLVGDAFASKYPGGPSACVHHPNRDAQWAEQNVAREVRCTLANNARENRREQMGARRHVAADSARGLMQLGAKTEPP
jgi:hypothetical protein